MMGGRTGRIPRPVIALDSSCRRSYRCPRRDRIGPGPGRWVRNRRRRAGRRRIAPRELLRSRFLALFGVQTVLLPKKVANDPRGEGTYTDKHELLHRKLDSRRQDSCRVFTTCDAIVEEDPPMVAIDTILHRERRQFRDHDDASKRMGAVRDEFLAREGLERAPGVFVEVTSVFFGGKPENVAVGVAHEA